MWTRNSSWSAKAPTFVIAAQLPQQQLWRGREALLPTSTFSFLFFFSYSGRWNLSIPISCQKRAHGCRCCNWSCSSFFERPKDLLVLFLHSSISFFFFFFWFVFILFSHSLKQFAKFSCFFSLYRARRYLQASFLFSFVSPLRFQFLGSWFCLWELRVSAYWLTWASWLEALDVWIVTARSNAGPFFGGSRQQRRRPWKRMVGRSDSSSSMILQVMLSILMMVVAIWMHSNMVIRIPSLISFRRAILFYGSAFCG